MWWYLCVCLWGGGQRVVKDWWGGGVRYLWLQIHYHCFVHCKGLPSPWFSVLTSPNRSPVWKPSHFYPGYQKFFPACGRMLRCQAAVYHVRVTVVFFLAETGNRAWKVSGTQGKPLLFRIAKHKSYKVVSANILRKVSMSTMSLFFGGYQFKNSSKNIIWKQELLHSISLTLLILLFPAASLAASFLCTCVSIFWLLHQKAQSPLIAPQGTFCL